MVASLSSCDEVHLIGQLINTSDAVLQQKPFALAVRVYLCLVGLPDLTDVTGFEGDKAAAFLREQFPTFYGLD